jgi:hypothetical protein
VPSDNVGNEQLVAAPTVYVHVTVEVPFVADTVTSSPVRAPGIEISGVESLVMLSELDAPLSDVANKSGADREGGLVAIVTGKALDASDSLPNGSVNVAEMFHVPSVSVGRVQFVAEPITYVHDTVLVPLVAEMVMVSPFAPPAALKVGVASLVLLSESDDPESDDAERSTPAGADGAVPSIVMGSADEEVEVLPAGSVNVDEMFHVPSVSVGSVQFVAVPITYVHDTVVVPLVAEMVMVSPLVPPLALNVGVVSLVLLSESDAPESDVANKSRPVGADGAVPSIVIGDDPVAWPVFPAASATEADNVQIPSDNVGNEQLVAAPTV